MDRSPANLVGQPQRQFDFGHVKFMEVECIHVPTLQRRDVQDQLGDFGHLFGKLCVGVRLLKELAQETQGLVFIEVMHLTPSRKLSLGRFVTAKHIGVAAIVLAIEQHHQIVHNFNAILFGHNKPQRIGLGVVNAVCQIGYQKIHNLAGQLRFGPGIPTPVETDHRFLIFDSLDPQLRDSARAQFEIGVLCVFREHEGIEVVTVQRAGQPLASAAESRFLSDNHEIVADWDSFCGCHGSGSCLGKCEVRSHIYTSAIISMKQQAEFAKNLVIIW
jgi:hypothetical protein